MKVNHRKYVGPAVKGKNKPAAYITTTEADRLRAANKTAVERATKLQIENEALRRRNAELLETNKRLIAAAVKK